MKTFLPRIQMLRLLAASMVLIGHLMVKVGEVPGVDLGAFVPLHHARVFAGGVDIFFVVSGFIMYVISRGEFGQPGAAGRFFARRLARIVPMYWLFTTAMVAAAVVFRQHVNHNDLSFGHVLASYLFLPVNNAYGDMYPVLILGWTLNFEMFFYVMFALALRHSPRRGLALLLAVVGGAGLWGWIARPEFMPLAFWCQPLVFEFLFGVGLGWLYARGFRFGWFAGLAVGTLSVVALYLGAQYGTEASPFWPVRFAYMGIPALGICAAAALTPPSEAPPGPVQRWLVMGGDASYVLYLSHPFSLAAMALLWSGLGFTSPWLFVAVAFAACMSVGLAIHLVLEKPVTSALNQWVRRSYVPASLPVNA